MAKKKTLTKKRNPRLKTSSKNPVAVQIGQRIKQARKMAGFNSAASLLAEIPEWGSGRLGNYEAGISVPSPDDVKLIASITGSSPCWIMFGLGPIRSTGRDLQAIRQQNFAYVFEQCRTKKGAIARFVSATGLSRSAITEHLDNPFLALTDKLARKVEKFARKPAYWLDEQHVESDPVCAAFPLDMQRVMQIYSNLPADKKQMFVKMAEVFGES